MYIRSHLYARSVMSHIGLYNYSLKLVWDLNIKVYANFDLDKRVQFCSVMETTYMGKNLLDSKFLPGSNWMVHWMIESHAYTHPPRNWRKDGALFAY